MCALAANRKRPTMPQAAISTNVHQALDVHLHALAQVAFDLALSFDHGANPAQIIFTEVPDPRVETHLRFNQNRRRARSANSVNSCKTDLRSFVGRKIDTCDTSHCLSLSLFVLGIAANHAHYTFSVHELALITDFSDRRPYFHVCSRRTYLYRYVIRPRSKSYGDNSTRTRSPGSILMKCFRILPEICART